MQYWIGAEPVFSFGQKVFHLIALSSSFLFVLLGCGSFLASLPLSAAVSLLLALLMGFAYYLSRFRDKFILGAAIGFTAVYLGIILNFFTMNGSQGPALYSLFVLSLCLGILSHSRYMPYILGINLLSALVLLGLEYFRPQWESPHPQFSNELMRLSSIGLIYLVVSCTLLLGTAYVKKQLEAYHRRIREQMAELKQKEQALEKANTQKDQLFKLIGHDLRSPLASIESFLDLLNGDLDEATRQELQGELLSLSQNARLLLENILQWARRSNQISYEPLVLRNLIEQALGTLRPMAKQKGIDLEVAVSAGQVLQGDANLLQAALRNLVANAIKFTATGGAVSVEYQQVGAEHQILVRDNGIGIEPAQQKSLFKEKPVLRPGTADEKGLGLGLQLSLQFIRQHGGNISVESSLGAGSVFTIHLPQQKETAEPAGDEKAPQSPEKQPLFKTSSPPPSSLEMNS